MNRDPLQFSYDFDARKAIDAASLLLSRHQNRMDRFRLLKLLYVSDRESIKEFRHPICGGDYASMPLGPVLDEVFDAIRYSRPTPSDPTKWAHQFKNDGMFITQKARTPGDFLSRADERILNLVDDKYGHMSFEDLLQFVHTELPEWSDPGRGSTPIETNEILRVFGLERNEIEEIGSHVLAQREHRRSTGS